MNDYSSDEQIIEGCLKNESEAQKALFYRYNKKMMGVCVRYCKSYQEAEDVLQDGFIKVFNSLLQFKNKGSFEGWIRRVIVNTALENLRKNKKTEFDVPVDEIAEPGLNETITSNISAKVLLNIIQNMPEGYKTIFNLFAIEGYSHKEISEMLNISESTSKSQYLRARGYIQKIVKKEIPHVTE